MDLYAVGRQAVRASVERYTLKELEAFHGFERSAPLREASLHLRAFERALELGKLDVLPGDTRAVIEAYNRDDCLSTVRLRDWLEQLRTELVGAGHVIPRPEPQPDAPGEALSEHQQRVQELYNRLASNTPLETGERSEEEQGRWLLANMLDWHRREQKASWWEYFRLRALPDEELIEEKAALAGLTFLRRVDTPKKSVVDRYGFPPQECELRKGDKLKTREDGSFGEVAAIDPATCIIDIRKGPTIAELHPSSVFKHSVVGDVVKREALMRLGEWVAENDIDGPGPFRACRDLLLRRAPRPALRYTEADGSLSVAREWVTALDYSVLPIQGPPGAGKTYTGARMITSLVRAGKKVGITALSHKVIRNLLDEVVAVAEKERTSVRCLQKVDERSGEPHPAIGEVKDNDTPLAGLQSDEAHVVAGTAWLWASPSMSRPWMCCSSTRPGSCRLLTSWPSGTRPETSSC